MRSRVTGIALAVALLAGFACAEAAADETSTAEVVLDGKSTTADVRPLDGDGSAPRPDDVLRFRGSRDFELLRGTSGSLRFRSAGGRLFEIGEDGKECLVALRVGGVVSAGDAPDPDPLALTSEEVARLRGVVVEFDDDARLDPLFARLDGARCFVACGAHEDGTLPSLPAGLRSLRVGSFHAEGALDLSTLSGQTDLRSLEIPMGRVADFGPLAPAQRLRSLEAPVHPENASSMPALRGLRTFRLAFDSEVRDGAFLACFPALVSLDVSHSLVRDLSALGGLSDLRDLDAEDARIASLPDRGLEGLRKARLFGHRLTPDAVARFVAAHPAAAIEHDRRAAFLAGLAGADGIRVWQGEGTPRGARRAPRHEAAGEDAVREFLDCVRLDEQAYGWPCLCAEAAPVQIEIRRAGETLATLGIRHEGEVVDGLHGGVLTDASITALGAWLAARGLPECEQMGALVARRRAAARRPGDVAAVRLGAARVEELRDAKSDVAVVRALQDLAPTAEERIEVCIRAWHDVATACGEEAARRGVPGDVRRYLRDHAEPGAVVAVADRMFASPEDALIAAWIVAGLRDDRHRFPAGWCDRARLTAARALLATDDPKGRDVALRALRDRDVGDAVPDLLRLLPDEAADGAPATRPTPFQADAATTLARWGDASLLPRLRAIVAASTDDEGARSRALSEFDDVVRRRR